MVKGASSQTDRGGRGYLRFWDDDGIVPSTSRAVCVCVRVHVNTMTQLCTHNEKSPQ